MDDNMEISSPRGLEALGEDIDIDIDITHEQVDDDYMIEDARPDVFTESYQMDDARLQTQDDIMLDDDQASLNMADAEEIQESVLEGEMSDAFHAADGGFGHEAGQQEQDVSWEEANADATVNELLSTPAANILEGEAPVSHVEQLADTTQPDVESIPAVESAPAVESVPAVESAPAVEADSAEPQGAVTTEDAQEVEETGEVLSQNDAKPDEADENTLEDDTPNGKRDPDASEHGTETQNTKSAFHQVLVTYHETEYALFSSSETEDPDTFFLKDVAIVREPLQAFLTALRGVIHEDLAFDDEVCVAVEELGLEISESSTACSTTSFAQLFELYRSLLRNDGVEDYKPLRILLASRPDFSKRLANLVASASEGRGLSEVVSWDDTSEDNAETEAGVERDDEAQNDDSTNHAAPRQEEGQVADETVPEETDEFGSREALKAAEGDDVEDKTEQEELIEYDEDATEAKKEHSGELESSVNAADGIDEQHLDGQDSHQRVDEGLEADVKSPTTELPNDGEGLQLIAEEDVHETIDHNSDHAGDAATLEDEIDLFPEQPEAASNADYVGGDIATEGQVEPQLESPEDELDYEEEFPDDAEGNGDEHGNSESLDAAEHLTADAEFVPPGAEEAIDISYEDKALDLGDSNSSESTLAPDDSLDSGLQEAAPEEEINYEDEEQDGPRTPLTEGDANSLRNSSSKRPRDESEFEELTGEALNVPGSGLSDSTGADDLSVADMQAQIMYAPLPPRPKKTNITRTRTGCYTCRARHRKCDEAKPACQRCVRQGLQCEGYAVRFSWLDTTASTSLKVEDSEAKKWAAIRAQEEKADERKARRGKQKQQVARTADESLGSTSVDDATATPSVPSMSNTPSAESLAAESLESPQSVGPESQWVYIKSSPSTPDTTWHESYFQPSRAWSPASSRAASSDASGLVSAAPDDTIEEIPRDMKQLALQVRKARLMNSMPPSISMVPGFDRPQDRLYLSHFSDYMSPIIYPALAESLSLSTSPCVRDAILALTASNMAHLQMTTKDTRNGVVRRELTESVHLKHAIHYYNSVIRNLFNPANSSSVSPESRLAATILCAIFELDTGAPKTFFTHVSGADAMVVSQHELLSQSKLGQELLSLWVAMRAHKNLNKLPFRPLEGESEEAMLADCEYLVHNYKNKESEILTLLSHANRIHDRIILEKCMALPDEDPHDTMRRTVEWYTKHYSFPFVMDDEIRQRKRIIGADALVKRLDELRLKLDDWHDRLGPVDYPMEKFTSQTMRHAGSGDGSDTLTVIPLVFHSYQAAMDYLYYTMAHVYSCDELLGLYVFDTHSGPTTLATAEAAPLNPWVLLTLRIIAGIDLQSCDSQDTYRLGLLWIIFNVTICCPDRRVTRYLLDHVLPQLEQQVQYGHVLFNLSTTKQWLRAQDAEIARGRLPLLFHTMLFNDVDVLARVDSSQQTWAAVHGRTRDGQMFNDFIRIQ